MEDDEQIRFSLKCNALIYQLIEQSELFRDSLLYCKIPPKVIDIGLASNYSLRKSKEMLMQYQDKLKLYQLDALDYAGAIIDDNIQYLKILKEQGEA